MKQIKKNYNEQTLIARIAPVGLNNSSQMTEHTVQHTPSRCIREVEKDFCPEVYIGVSELITLREREWCMFLSAYIVRYCNGSRNDVKSFLSSTEQSNGWPQPSEPQCLWISIRINLHFSCIFICLTVKFREFFLRASTHQYLSIRIIFIFLILIFILYFHTHSVYKINLKPCMTKKKNETTLIGYIIRIFKQ